MARFFLSSSGLTFWGDIVVMVGMDSQVEMVERGPIGGEKKMGL